MRRTIWILLGALTLLICSCQSNTYSSLRKKEKKLIDLLRDRQLVLPGKTEVFNVTQDLFNRPRLRLLPLLG